MVRLEQFCLFLLRQAYWIFLQDQSSKVVGNVMAFRRITAHFFGLVLGGSRQQYLASKRVFAELQRGEGFSLFFQLYCNLFAKIEGKSPFLPISSLRGFFHHSYGKINCDFHKIELCLGLLPNEIHGLLSKWFHLQTLEVVAH